MGEVYEAEDTRKHRIVALKLISPQFSTDATFRARMQREADTAGRLTEAHIVPIHDYGDIDGQFYVEMRMIDGISLRTLLTNYGPMPPARTVAIVQQIAAALDAAHANGVTHRDVKPENILVTEDDFAYLVDFGIARGATDPGLTQHGVALGTYNYMAPERFTGDEVTYRSDIYALACVLGECLTGAPPYRADSVERLIAAHLLEPAPRPSQLRPGRIPPALDPVIGKGMAKNPADRYFTAGDLAAAAHSALAAPEQQQEAAILRQGANATLLASNYPGSGASETVVRPVPWRPSGGYARHLGPPGPPAFSQQSIGPQPDFTSPARGKRKLWILAAAALLAVAAVGTTAYLGTRPSAASKQQASGQSELPFKGIDFRLSPGGVALDKAGDVYVTSEGMYGRVVELAPGSSAPTVLPLRSLSAPGAGGGQRRRRVRRRFQQPGGEVDGRVDQPDRAAVHRPQLPRRGSGGRPGHRLRRRPGQQPGGEVDGRLDRPDRVAVFRPQKPGRRGRRPRRQRVRHRHRQRPGADARGRGDRGDRAPVHRRCRALGHRGGQRRRRVRHRARQQSGAEAAGRVQHPDGAAVDRPEHALGRGGGQGRQRLCGRPRQRPNDQAGALIRRSYSPGQEAGSVAVRNTSLCC